LMRRRGLGAAAAFVVGALLAHGATRADDAGMSPARRAKIVAVIGGSGGSRAISVGEVEDRIAEMPAFQRATFGRTPEDARRRFLTEVVVPDALLSLGAEGAKLEARLDVAYAVDRARSSATLRAIRERLGPASAIPVSDVRSYYEQNIDRYAPRERYQIWRILCKTLEDARSVLDAARADPTPKNFAQLARDNSQDKATYLRAGNLGFLSVDGSSNEPGLRVPPAVVRAALAVRDGEFVPAPVSEGEFFAVIWRRGTSAPKKRTLEEAAPQIRDALQSGRIKEEVDKLVLALRAAKVRDVREDLLDTFDLATEADAGVRPR
jgi:peptidyl-prolyl cis-trans isomerase C